MFDPNEFGTEIVNAVKAHVAGTVAPLLSRIDDLEAEVKLLAGRRYPERGERGDQGPPGDNGVGLASAFIDREGQLVVTFTDGTVGPLGTVVGLNGNDGKDASIDAPPEMIDEISKAIALAAESLPLQQAQQNANPVVVNFIPPATAKRGKTITTRRDEKGNLIAQVMESN